MNPQNLVAKMKVKPLLEIGTLFGCTRCCQSNCSQQFSWTDTGLHMLFTICTCVSRPV